MKKKQDIIDSVTRLEKVLVGNKPGKLKARLTPWTNKMFRTFIATTGKTEDEAVEALLGAGLRQYAGAVTVKEQIEQLKAQVKQYEEDIAALLKKDAEQLDFFITWGSEMDGYKGLVKTRAHYERCQEILESEGKGAAQKFHQAYKEQLVGIADRVPGPNEKLN